MAAIEIEPQAPAQPDFGFPNTPVTLLPLTQVEIRGTGIEVIAERMAAQHLKDRQAPYFVGSAALDRDFAWATIAGINPEYQPLVLGVQRAMREARRENVRADKGYEHDEVPEHFEEVVDGNTQAVLRDILRMYASDYPEHVPECAAIVEEEILAVFPEETRGVDSATFEGVSAGDLFKLMLEGQLILPGCKIKPKGEE